MNTISNSRRVIIVTLFIALSHLPAFAQLATLNYLPRQTSLHKRVGIVISDLGSYPGLHNVTQDCGQLGNEYPLEHVQAIATLRDRGDGKTRWVITGSQDYYGWIVLLEADGSPPVEVVPGQSAPGRVLWATWYNSSNPAGIYNHPGDINIVGDTLVVALQNWEGKPEYRCYLDRDSGRAEDAVGFYDLSNPTNLVYQGKLTSTEMFSFAREISDIRFFMAGPEYYILQVHSETFLSRSTPLPVMSQWTRSGVSVAGPAVGSGSFLGPSNEYLTASVGLTPDASGKPYPPPRAIISQVFMSSAGQGSFTRMNYTVPANWGNPGFNWVGDFNDDGLADIASAINNQVYLKLNTGPGFTETNYTVPANWGSSGFNWVGDFNNDGLADIASAINNQVYLKLNNGAGFTQTNYTVPNNWGSSGFNWVGDFNNDGLADIASAINNQVYLKLNNGAGFTQTNYTVPANWGSPGFNWVGDFNNDGLADIASANYSVSPTFEVVFSEQVLLKLNTGVGFTQTVVNVPPNWNLDSNFNWVGDFNGDGRDDFASGINTVAYMKHSLFSGGVEPPQFSWFDRRPNGGLELGWPRHSLLESAVNLPGDWMTETTSPGWATVATLEPQRFFRLRRTAGDVTGFAQSTFSMPPTWGGAGYNWVEDFNGDGKDDIASANGGNLMVNLSVNGPTISSDPQSQVEFRFVTRFCENCGYDVDPRVGPREVKVLGPSVIANRLGQPMISCVDYEASPYFHLETVLVLSNVFEPKTTNYPAPVPNTWGISGFNWAGDFNGDGLADIASAINNQVYLKLNTGTGFSQTNYTVPLNWNTSGPYNWAGDFNGDGLTDIATALFGEVYLKFNTGTGFTQAVYSVPNTWSQSGYNWIGDFNGDGRDDIASAIGTQVYLKLCYPTGFTQVVHTVSNNWNSTSSGYNWAGDFNGDGFADIASAVNTLVYLKLNNGTNGPAGFTEITNSVPGNWNTPGYNWAGDFNGDGRTDLLAANASTAFFKFKTATGFDEVEAFRQDLFFTWGSGGTFAWVGDFDGDGRDDIARAVGGNVYVDGVSDP